MSKSNSKSNKPYRQYPPPSANGWWVALVAVPTAGLLLWWLF